MDAHFLAELLAFNGIETTYHDAWGNPCEVTVADQYLLLAALGFPVEDESACRVELLQRQLDFWQQLIAPVSVQQDPMLWQLELQVPLALANTEFTVQVCTEQGEQHQYTLVPVDGELTQVVVLNNEEYHQYVHQFKQPLPHGYHQLQLTCKGTELTVSQQLVITPGQCFQPQAFQAEKQWGTAVQLYALRSERNWGIGDFSDLQQLIIFLASQGADFVGLNPIHALYPALPDNASPYSPSSRRWLNIIYLDVTAVPGYEACDAVQQLVKQPAFQQQLAEQRAANWVDYPAVMALKLPVLNLLYQWFIAEPQQHGLHAAYQQFVADGGESLQQCALYDALHAWLYQQDPQNWGWPNWPEQYRDPESAAVQAFAATHQAEQDFYCFLQFLAQQQLAATQQLATDKGMLIGLYRDLAVGVSAAATEIWGNPELYCRDASIGAPPDPLGPTGQNWGLPPMRPFQLYQQGYQPFIDLLRANMQNAGALRIDHVMALLRLWWVPKGAVNASSGAYVYYPIMDLLGILALESQRQQVVIIGEDLGTVPEGIRELLQQYGIYSYRVFFFETAADGGYISPAHYPLQAMATLSTHDLPTLIGFWHCEDLKLGQRLGLYQDPLLLEQLYQQRHRNKQRILDSLHGHGRLPEHYARSVEHLAMDQTLNFALQQHLATGHQQLLCLQIEDWLQMTEPVNVPGTSTEYPNWRRKLSQPLEQWTQSAAIQLLLKQLTSLRCQSQ